MALCTVIQVQFATKQRVLGQPQQIERGSDGERRESGGCAVYTQTAHTRTHRWRDGLRAVFGVWLSVGHLRPKISHLLSYSVLMLCSGDVAPNSARTAKTSIIVWRRRRRRKGLFKGGKYASFLIVPR